MSLNSHLNDIIGKKISRVITYKNEGGSPKSQVHLVFDDGTSFEFYGDIQNTKGLWRTESPDGYKVNSADCIRNEYPDVVGSNIFVNATYRQLKPQLQNLWGDARATHVDAMTALDAFINECINTMGETIIPYMKQFYREVRAADSASHSTEDLETVSPQVHLPVAIPKLTLLQKKQRKKQTSALTLEQIKALPPGAQMMYCESRGMNPDPPPTKTNKRAKRMQESIADYQRVMNRDPDED